MFFEEPTFFDGSFPSNDDFSSSVFFHGLEGIAARSNQQAHKVNFRVLVLWNHYLVVDSEDNDEKEMI